LNDTVYALESTTIDLCLRRFLGHPSDRRKPL
jgi:hypothetical protein